jgi:small subunit ribosomal protein S16
MLTIKLQRIGKKHQPSFRVVVSERRSKLAGPPLEDLGSYDLKTKKLNAKKDRIDYWLRVGAKATPTVHNLLIKNNIISGEKAPIKTGKAKTASGEGGEKQEAAAEAKTEAPAGQQG